MKVNTVRYTIQIPGGFYKEQSEAVRELFLQYPQHKCRKEGYWGEYSRPEEFSSDEGRELWKAIIAAKDEKLESLAHYAKWDTFNITVYEADFAEMAAKLGTVSIRETEVIPIVLPSSAVQTEATYMLEMHEKLNKMAAKTLDQLAKVVDFYENGDGTTSQDCVNHRCGQHQPNVALMNMNETMLFEDACTDQLQDYLNDGWRIIAVSPQPDQRRPDYILARYNINYDRNRLPGGAERGHNP